MGKKKEKTITVFYPAHRQTVRPRASLSASPPPRIHHRQHPTPTPPHRCSFLSVEKKDEEEKE
jgi:hypothetical protein